jgi:hypothetical protein
LVLLGDCCHGTLDDHGAVAVTKIDALTEQQLRKARNRMLKSILDKSRRTVENNPNDYQRAQQQFAARLSKSPRLVAFMRSPGFDAAMKEYSRKLKRRPGTGVK